AELEVSAIAGGYGLQVDPRARVDTLPVGVQQRVEIVKALRRGPPVLILDEPTAVLTPHEVDDLFAVLRRLRDQGVTIVLIRHKVAGGEGFAHRGTVVRAGRGVGGGTADSLSQDRIAELMVGRPVTTTLTRAEHPPGEPALEARDLIVRDDRGLDAVRGVSFAVRAGEIVGIAGVEGNGQHELVECLAGLRPAAQGEVRIGGKLPRPGARGHLAAGLAHIPSDRRKRGLVPEMTLAENLILGLHHERELGHGPFLDPRRLAARAQRLLAEFDVRPAAPGYRAAQLSGGNQQKLLPAPALSRPPRP